MIDLKKLLTERLSGIAKYKENTKEICTKNKYGRPITIEILDVDTETYIVRRYYDNGKLWYQDKYQNGKLHGTCKRWHKNGKLRWEYEYQNGKEHGTWKGWYKDGQLWYQREYQNGILI